jgi:hypothetical protein
MTATTFEISSAAQCEPSCQRAAGRVLTLAGAVFGLSNLFQYGVQSGLLHLHEATLGLSWPIAVTVFIVMLRRLRASGGEAGKRTAGWSRLGILTMIASALTLLGFSIALKDFSLMFWMTPVGMGMYAIAWATAAVKTRRGWMAAQAIGAFTIVGLTITLLGTPAQYLAYAVGLLAFAFAPGVFMILSDKT